MAPPRSGGKKRAPTYGRIDKMFAAALKPAAPVVWYLSHYRSSFQRSRQAPSKRAREVDADNERSVKRPRVGSGTVDDPMDVDVFIPIADFMSNTSSTWNKFKQASASSTSNIKQASASSTSNKFKQPSAASIVTSTSTKFKQASAASSASNNKFKQASAASSTSNNKFKQASAASSTSNNKFKQASAASSTSNIKQPSAASIVTPTSIKFKQPSAASIVTSTSTIKQPSAASIVTPTSISTPQRLLKHILHAVNEIAQAQAQSPADLGKPSSTPVRAQNLQTLLDATRGRIVAVATSATGSSRKNVGQALLPLAVVLIRELALRACMPIAGLLEVITSPNQQKDSRGKFLTRGHCRWAAYISAVMCLQHAKVVKDLEAAGFKVAPKTKNIDGLVNGIRDPYSNWNFIWTHLKNEARTCGLPTVPQEWRVHFCSLAWKLFIYHPFRSDWARVFWGAQDVESLGANQPRISAFALKDSKRKTLWKIMKRHLDVFQVDVRTLFIHTRGRFPPQCGAGDVLSIPEETVALWMAVAWHIPQKSDCHFLQRDLWISHLPTPELLDDLRVSNAHRPRPDISPAGAQHDLLVKIVKQAEETLGINYRGKVTLPHGAQLPERGRVARFSELGYELFCAATRPDFKLLTPDSTQWRTAIDRQLGAADIFLDRTGSSALQFTKRNQMDLVRVIAKHGGFNLSRVGKMITPIRHGRVVVAHVRLWWDGYVWRTLYERLSNPSKYLLRVKRRAKGSKITNLGRRVKVVRASGTSMESFEGAILALLKRENMNEFPGGPDDDAAIQRFLDKHRTEWQSDMKCYDNDDNDDDDDDDELEGELEGESEGESDEEP
ncbi:hypothetical protein MVEN_02238900 [Mycena venus]|uniref:Uncharacterized protein n=1 Tax=Mycena venus TaxID=2733690 RepID=A0A8H6X833_9AGAR|nr:hypothetical protein MVEN_02238900 [Mycena venus]